MTGLFPPRGLRVSVTVAEEAACGDDASFAQLCRARAGTRPHAILLGGGSRAEGARHECSGASIGFLAPVLLLEAKARLCRLHSAREIAETEADPFELLDALLRPVQDAAAVPIAAGYVAYEAGRLIEALPGRAEDRLALPDLLFLLPSTVLMHDRDSGTMREYRLQWEDADGPLALIDAFAPPAATPPAATPPAAPVATGRGFTRTEYEAAVGRVRGHILEGDVYQVNLSQRFRFPLPGDPFELWLRLFAANPAPFYAWVDAGDHQVLSASMERFFRIDGEGPAGGRHIETRPIKGTRRRGRDADEDKRLAAELLGSEKDDAELSMNVDLERNDLGRICETGSVRVAEHKRIEAYANVQHLVSVVSGRLKDGLPLADVFRALFPGGSVTGCPKIRAMEIIDALEPETRHVYTGAIGYVTSDGSADFNIAIRTAVVRSGLCHLSVGGGIVFDSDPREEYIETLHKGRTFFDLTGVSTDLDERD